MILNFEEDYYSFNRNIKNTTYLETPTRPGASNVDRHLICVLDIKGEDCNVCSPCFFIAKKEPEIDPTLLSMFSTNYLMFNLLAGIHKFLPER